MPRIPRQLPADRCFARVDRFQCECPACGQLIVPSKRQKPLPLEKRTIAEQRASLASTTADGFSARRMVYNPHTQRLRCPSCSATYIVGLLLFPYRRHGLPADAPIDARPTRRERLEMARLGGGWWAKQAYREEVTPVNYVIEAPCSCPPTETDPACPVHGPAGDLPAHTPHL